MKLTRNKIWLSAVVLNVLITYLCFLIGGAVVKAHGFIEPSFFKLIRFLLLLEILLLRFDATFLDRRLQLVKLEPQHFPTVETAGFLEWQRVKTKATDILLWMVSGLFLIKYLAIILFCCVQSDDMVANLAMAFCGTFCLWLFGGIMAASIYEWKARKLLRATGIHGPSWFAHNF